VLDDSDLKAIIAGSEADTKGHTESLFLLALTGRKFGED
jgi:hypothetical protein